MNIFNALSQGKGKLNEENLSAMFGFLLNPNNEHGLGDLFLKRFLKLISSDKRDFSSITDENYSMDITFEAPYDCEGKSRRIDLDLKFFVNNDEKLRILIENKIKNASADKTQFLDEYLGVKSNLIEEGLKEIEVVMVFLTHPSNDKHLVAEYNELDENILMDGHYKKWIYWDNNNEKDTIRYELKQILIDESMMVINPISEYIRHTIKAFVCFIKESMQYVSVSSKSQNPLENDTIKETRNIQFKGVKYQIEKYKSSAIKIYNVDNDEYVPARPILRNIISEYNIDIPVTTTRQIGRDLIKFIDDKMKGDFNLYSVVIDKIEEINEKIERLLIISDVSKKFTYKHENEYIELTNWFALNVAQWNNLGQYGDYINLSKEAIDEKVKKYNSLDLNECIAALIYIHREQHFMNSNVIEQRIKSGDLNKLINKLKNLIKLQ